MHKVTNGSDEHAISFADKLKGGIQDVFAMDAYLYGITFYYRFLSTF